MYVNVLYKRIKISVQDPGLVLVHSNFVRLTKGVCIPSLIHWFCIRVFAATTTDCKGAAAL